MDLLSQIDFDVFSRQSLKSAVLVSLLSVWVLVVLFYYLNHYTKRRYFTIWTAAWLFYALWLTLTFGLQGDQPLSWLLMLETWCVGVSAVFLFWGSQIFLGESTRERLFAWFLLFLLVASFTGAFYSISPLQIEVPLYILIGVSSLLTARSFFKHRRKHGYIGATLLTLGFALWGCYMTAFPILQHSRELVSVALFISAIIQLLLAVSMIVLVLEEARETHRATVAQLQARRQETDLLHDRVVTTEERYRTLFEKAGEAIVITDAEELRILELNHTAERLLGIERTAAQRHLLAAFCPIKDSAGQPPRSGGEWFELICRKRPLSLIRKNGGLVEVEVDGAKINFDGRAACQFFIRELTERTRLEQQLRQAEKLSALGQMISGIAHELNNPLAVVKGYLDLVLSHHDLPAQTRGDLEKVAHESNRAAKLVRNFLSFAREQPARRKVVQFNDLIRSVAELRRFELKVNGITLELELDQNLPSTTADPDAAQQVLFNLINNAAHAMSNSPEGLLRITTLRVGEFIRISVEDSGPGVSPEIVSKVFEPFFTTKEVGSGTGLGLSIAHSMMMEHKGRIFYERSTLGGAGFVLEFPITLDETPAAQEVREPVRVTAPAAPRERSGRPILVLDDEPMLAEMLAEVLGVLGHDATVCNSAAHALELLQARQFDLVVSDFRMPGMNGREFYERVKARHPALAKRIVFLTGDVVNEETQSFLQSTGNPHLDKPFTLPSVEKVLTEVLQSNGRT